MIDASESGSPGWWLHRLLNRMANELPDLERLHSYYEGTNGIPAHADKALRQAFQRLMYMARTNFPELVVEAVRERMKPTGFRTGAAGDDLDDREAWRIWQANSLDADSALVDRFALSMRRGYVIVGGTNERTGLPRITPEDPRQVIHEASPQDRREIVAALKLFRDDVNGTDVAYLYRPGLVYVAMRRAAEDGALQPTSGWEWTGDPARLPEALGDVVPVIPFVLNPVNTAGVAEFEPHLPLIDRINYTILNRLEIATLQAFKQRAVKGVPDRDEHGNEINYDDIFAADPGALWVLPQTAEIWESGQVDLGPIRQAIRDDVQDLAAVTRTPLYYLTPDSSNGSAEGASLAREGLIFKTQDRIAQASESWEQVMSLAFRFAGDPERANRADMEVLWTPPDRFSLAERYDAASKAQAAGVPWRSVMADVLQFSPQQIARMEAERATDLLLTQSLAPTPNAPVA